MNQENYINFSSVWDAKDALKVKFGSFSGEYDQNIYLCFMKAYFDTKKVEITSNFKKHQLA